VTGPELVAPAGDWDCLRAAVANGADGVYFGLSRFNARMRAENFRAEELPDVMDSLHRQGVKGYVTLNVLVFTEELDEAVEELRLLNNSGVDAVIVQDVGIAELSRRLFPALPVHVSTQMTITSPEGVRFAKELGARRVVVARELSLGDLAKFGSELPLEVFVHGALCVAYSGQCLTSESLGQRSANRGECAQACRMPYQIIVDGKVRDLGEKNYLLSPQDLAAIDEIPELMRLGVRSFKIEGRLKTPEYVAAVTRVYREAIDAALREEVSPIGAEDRYRLEMTFSRGLFSGWLHGVNHQKLVEGRYGKKRGSFLGRVTSITAASVEIDARDLHSPSWAKPGDGIVFENPADTDSEQGGRVFQVEGNRLLFRGSKLDLSKIRPGTRVWKTSDPALARRLRKTWQARTAGRLGRKVPLGLRFSGGAGRPLVLEVHVNGESLCLSTSLPLESSRKFPLTIAALTDIFSRLDETPYRLESLDYCADGPLFLPKSELGRLRRSMLLVLEKDRTDRRIPSGSSMPQVLADLRALAGESRGRRECEPGSLPVNPKLAVLCRTMEQLEAAIDCGAAAVYADFEDLRGFRDAVGAVRKLGASEIFLATPRIEKPGEEGFFRMIETARPDGVLVRNVGALSYFRRSPLRMLGDFSLNVANPAAAAVFFARGLERLTISYDLNIKQVLGLLGASDSKRFELTIHQHVPMFHMEHCVFAAFLSKGTSFLDCGRPCEKHRVRLRDRVGIEHPLRADVGCRNTLFNARAQTGAEYFRELKAAGLTHYRVELLEENGPETETVVRAYRALLDEPVHGTHLWRQLQARSQLGITRGTFH
jgi:U32 family peptidase